MSISCAGVCARISEGKVEFLCRRVFRDWSEGHILVFPVGNNKDSEETPEEILERTFPIGTGMLALSYLSIWDDHVTKSTGEIVSSSFFWLVTDCCEDPTIGDEPELPLNTSLVWEEASKLRGLIHPSHRAALIEAIKMLPMLFEDFARPLLYFCPDLFPVR